jgi:2'-5' RNA ligase
VAVDVSPDVRDAIARAQAALRTAAPDADVRWVDPAQFHLTLKFLGHVPDSDVPRIVAPLEQAAADAAPIAGVARGIGTFPTPRRPRVVWAGIAGGVEPLRRLAAGVEAALVPLGFAPEGRPFQAHVTIGRVRSARGTAPLREAVETAAGVELGTWTVTEVVLYESRLRSTGAIYTAVARLPMRAGGP